jgi:ubiquinone/menaquinone biosynthesis C-methylase UbiE
LSEQVTAHYSGGADLTEAIAQSLQRAGKDLNGLTARDLATVDEFHIRGRAATLELADHMRLRPESRVLDIGSGLGGPARTIADAYGCHVTGVDLVPAFCDAAGVLSGWLGLDDRVAFQQGNATALPFADDTFDAAMTIHVAMNIAAKSAMYGEALRVVKPGGIFAVYDVLQGEGGEVLFPVPWAREPSISHTATPAEMESLLAAAGFEVLEVDDSTDESQRWFESFAAEIASSGPPAVSFQTFLGEDFPVMAQNQVRNLTERRIRTVSFICRA